MKNRKTTKKSTSTSGVLVADRGSRSVETNLLTCESDPIAQSKALANPSMHSQRLSRQFERTVDEPPQARDHVPAPSFGVGRPGPRRDLSGLLDIMEMVEATGETYDPSEGGFVFSKFQIDAAISARNRKNRALEAFAANR